MTVTYEPLPAWAKVPNERIREAVEQAVIEGRVESLSAVAHIVGWNEATLRRALGMKPGSSAQGPTRPQVRSATSERPRLSWLSACCPLTLRTSDYEPPDSQSRRP